MGPKQGRAARHYVHAGRGRDRKSGALVLIWDFQYDSYVSLSDRFGLLDYCWMASSTWLAFLMVDCCALSLGSSLFSEVLRTSYFPGGLTHEFSARLASIYPVVGRRNTMT